MGYCAVGEDAAKQGMDDYQISRDGYTIFQLQR